MGANRIRNSFRSEWLNAIHRTTLHETEIVTYMAHDDQNLHELCRRVAAGVPGAREEFSERVAPLMELLAKRSLSGPRNSARLLRRADSGRAHSAGSPGATSGVATGERHAKIARLTNRFCRSLIEKVCRQQRQPGAETCAVRPPWPTQRGSAFRS
jgi:hypothetical protein